MNTPRLTHLDEVGRPRMVNVGDKETTLRRATAEGVLTMRPATLTALLEGQSPKGDPLIIAQLAGIQAAKKTWDLIPLCHPLPLTGIDVQLTPDETIPGLRAVATTSVIARTGVEMEALTAVTIALLAAYDTLKAIDREMRIEGVRLLQKSGGHSQDWDINASQ
jgi:cyclic pyranopterin phosphate synthase